MDGANLGKHAIRIAVKGHQTLDRMAGILLNVCSNASDSRSAPRAAAVRLYQHR